MGNACCRRRTRWVWVCDQYHQTLLVSTRPTVLGRECELFFCWNCRNLAYHAPSCSTNYPPHNASIWDDDEDAFWGGWFDKPRGQPELGAGKVVKDAGDTHLMTKRIGFHKEFQMRQKECMQDCPYRTTVDSTPGAQTLGQRPVARYDKGWVNTTTLGLCVWQPND